MTETEYKLLNWRGDSLNAERMCADILVMQDFESVDPQSPLGGPDGTKDILCKKGGRTYLAAVYFAPLPKTSSDPINKILLPLTTIEVVFLWAGIIFSVLTIWMFYQSYDQIKKLKSGGQISIETKTN